MAKWETINELDVQDLEDMMEFSAEDLTWIEVWGDQVAIIPYCQLEEFISGEQSSGDAPTQFVGKTRQSVKAENIKETNFGTYLEYAIYWCAYGPQSTPVITNNALEYAKKKCHPSESIKVGCQCHFIVRQLQLRPNDVVIIYTACRHIDKSNVVCHGNNAIGKPRRFNYAPHLTEDIRASVQDLVQKGFNVTMIWDKLISDVKHGSGELFTGISRDAFMTRQDILNIYNDTKMIEYVKDESDPRSVECWINECLDNFFFYQKQDVVQNIPFIIGIQTK